MTRKKRQDKPTSPGYTRDVLDTGFQQMQPVLADVVARLDEDLSLKALSQRAGKSPSHLQRTFAAVIGESPKQISQRLRLSRAAALLLTTRDTVLDIALACGFQSHEVFTRAFTARFAMPPAEYRARGFHSPITASQAAHHVATVDSVGPCVTLYHIGSDKNQERNPMPEITIRHIDPQPVLLIRRRVPRTEIAATIGGTLRYIFAYSQQHGIAINGHPLTRYSAMSPGMITMEPSMRIVGAAGVHPPSPEGVEVGELPGGLVAFAVHKGGYEGLQQLYADMDVWIEKNGYKPSGAPWEAYVTDPGEFPNPADWITEVFWPVSTP